MDVASMAHSLETRSPFLDHEVVELTSRLPTSWKIRGFQSKWILKRGLLNFLPQEVIRRRKMGFGIPLQKWLREDHHASVRRLLLSNESLERGYFNKEGVTRLLDEHRHGREDHGYRLWALLMLELWHRMFIDKTLKPNDGF